MKCEKKNFFIYSIKFVKNEIFEWLTREILTGYLKGSFGLMECY